MRASSKTAKRYHHGDLRQSLIQSALKILAKNGVEGLSIRAAAKLSGVSAAAPYRHFPTKEALLTAVLVQGFESLNRHLSEAVAAHPGNLTEQLLACAVAYIRYALENPEHAKLMHLAHTENSPELKQIHDATECQFFNLIEAAQKEGLIVEADTNDVATAAFAFIHGLSTMLIDENICLNIPDDLEAWIRRLAQLVWNGFAKRPLV
jgi:AcrR family transcriptional regulator